MNRQRKVNIFNIVELNAQSVAVAVLLFLTLTPLVAGFDYLAVAALSFGFRWAFSPFGLVRSR